LLGNVNPNSSVAGGAVGGGQANYNGGQHLNQQTTEDLKYHGTELVMLYDYKVYRGYDNKQIQLISIQDNSSRFQVAISL